MKTKISKYIFISVLALASATSCTDGFEGMNTNGQGVYPGDLIPDDNLVASSMPSLQQSIYFNYDYGQGSEWVFQLYQNLNGDLFSGMMSTINFGSSNSTYAMNDTWNSYAWITAYGYTMSTVNNVMKTINDYPEYDMSVYKAWNTVMKVAAMHRIAESYGPIIYSEFGKTSLGAKYDDQKSVFYQFFEELDEAVGELTKYESEFPGNRRFKKADLVYDGDMTKWIRYANTLRLRIAMTIVKVEPNKAKEEAEKAIKAGVIQKVSDNALVQMRHPLGPISQWGGDIAMSADMESILKGYNDPRLAKYFRAGSQAVISDYKGVRAGLGLSKESQNNPYLKQFYVPNFEVTDKSVIATAAEACFLRAEGALRGWDMGGSAGDLYRQGVEASFAQWGLGVDTYLDTDKYPIDYTDPDGKNSILAANKVSVKWDDAATREVNLQRIITQKWLALYPDGSLAWTDYRRTGYPKLFPVVKNHSEGAAAINPELGPRRLPYPSSESATNEVNYRDGVSKLGGADNATTRLWWDLAKPNF